jgi:hypothetical protein
MLLVEIDFLKAELQSLWLKERDCWVLAIPASLEFLEAAGLKS